MPRPLFDTQVAGMAAGFGEQIAYDALVRQMLKIELDKSSRFTDWARRPLSDSQLTYALADVTHLAKLYPMLRERLEEEGPAGLGDRRDGQPDRSGDLRRRAGERLEAAEAAHGTRPSTWRSTRPWPPGASAPPRLRDQPRGRILKDEAIDEVATQAPTDADGARPAALGAQGLLRLAVRAGPARRDPRGAERPGGLRAGDRAHRARRRRRPPARWSSC